VNRTLPSSCARSKLLFKAKRTAGEQRFVQSLLEQNALIAHTYESVRRFHQILTERDETALQPWACEAEASQIRELRRFGKTIAFGLGSGGKCAAGGPQSRTGRGPGSAAESLQTTRLWAYQSRPLTSSVGGSKRLLSKVRMTCKSGLPLVETLNTFQRTK
jgi:hypothetical protein